MNDLQRKCDATVYASQAEKEAAEKELEQTKKDILDKMYLFNINEYSYGRYTLLKGMVNFMFNKFISMTERPECLFQITGHEKQFKLKVWFNIDEIDEIVTQYYKEDPFFKRLVDISEKKYPHQKK